MENERLFRAIVGAAIAGGFFGFTGALLVALFGGDFQSARWVCGGLGAIFGFYLMHGPKSFDPTEEDLLSITDYSYDIPEEQNSPTPGGKALRALDSGVTALTLLWNLAMRGLLTLRLMRLFRAVPSLFVLVVFALLVLSPWIGGLAGLIALAALFRGAGSYPNFVIPSRR